MKLKTLTLAGITVAILALNASAATIVDTGFESKSSGYVYQDGGDTGDWKSWPGGYWDPTANDGAGAWFGNAQTWTVVTTTAHSGSQSVEAGIGGNLRQSYSPTGTPGSIENKTWTVGAWVYYDTSGGSSPSDAMTVQLVATNNWNITRANQNVQVNPTNLTANAWTYVELGLVVGQYDPSEGGLYTPGQPEYDNRIVNRMNVSFDVGALSSNVGKFFIDDVSLSAVPEPSILGLLALAPALALRRRRA